MASLVIGRVANDDVTVAFGVWLVMHDVGFNVSGCSHLIHNTSLSCSRASKEECFSCLPTTDVVSSSGPYAGGGGVRGGAHAPPPPPPPKSQKGPLDGIIKDLKWYKNRRGGVGIDNLNAFPAVWRPQISNFFRGACPRTSLKPLQSVQLPSQIRRDCPDSTWESRVPTRLSVGTRRVSRF